MMGITEWVLRETPKPNDMLLFLHDEEALSMENVEDKRVQFLNAIAHTLRLNGKKMTHLACPTLHPRLSLYPARFAQVIVLGESLYSRLKKMDASAFNDVCFIDASLKCGFDIAQKKSLYQCIN